jgi:hypothetical protein
VSWPSEHCCCDEGCIENDRSCAAGDADGCGQGTESTLAELASVAPGRKLRTQGLADSNQLQAVGRSGKADVVGRDSLDRAAESAFACFDGLPAFFDRAEVPALATRADNPKPSATRVERDTTADGECLYRFILAEASCAEDAMPIQT